MFMCIYFFFFSRMIPVLDNFIYDQVYIVRFSSKSCTGAGFGVSWKRIKGP